MATGSYQSRDWSTLTTQAGLCRATDDGLRRGNNEGEVKGRLQTVSGVDATTNCVFGTKNLGLIAKRRRVDEESGTG